MSGIEIKNALRTPAVTGEAARAKPTRARPASEGPRFQDMLAREVQRGKDLKFSAHALSRMEDRKIEITEAGSRKIREAVDAAERKGSRESLVLFHDLALIVSVRNRTVITAMDRDQMKEQVITHIDSAVMVRE